MAKCEWCGNEIRGRAYKYDDKYFCSDFHGICLKNYLFDKFDSEIDSEFIETEEDIMIDELERRRAW